MTKLCKNIYYCPFGFRLCFVSFPTISHFLIYIAHFKTLTLCQNTDSPFTFCGISHNLPGLWKISGWILETREGHITIFKMPAILLINAHRTSYSYCFHSVSKINNVSQRIYAWDAIIPYCPNPPVEQNYISFFLSLQYSLPAIPWYTILIFAVHLTHWIASSVYKSRVETIGAKPAPWPSTGQAKLVLSSIQHFWNENSILKITS